jgi:hypothetical protein
MRRFASPTAVFALLLIPGAAAARSSRASQPPQEKKDYLSDIEADKIRDAATPSERIKLFVTFAEDRLKKFQYELNRKTPERKRAEILNSMLNAYVGCVDDAADQIDLARQKQSDIRLAIKLMKSKAQEFLDVLEKLNQGGPEYDLYKDTLEDAIEGTKDAITDIDQAEKEMAPPPVRRKPT